MATDHSLTAAPNQERAWKRQKYVKAVQQLPRTWSWLNHVCCSMRIVSPRIFTLLVLLALVTIFLTGPLAVLARAGKAERVPWRHNWHERAR